MPDRVTPEQAIERLREEGTSWERIGFAVPLATWDALLDIAEAAQAMSAALRNAGDTEALAKTPSLAVPIGRANAAVVAALARLAAPGDADG